MKRIPGRSRPRHRPTSLPPLEKQIAGEIMTALRRIGCEVSSTQQSRASRQAIGMPDLHVTHAAWGVNACWIEVKRPGEKPSRAQREWHETARAAGVHVLVCVSAADALRQFGALPRRRDGDGTVPRGITRET